MLCLSWVLSVKQFRILPVWNGFLPPRHYSMPLSSFQNLMETSLLWEAVPVQLPSLLIPPTPPCCAVPSPPADSALVTPCLLEAHREAHMCFPWCPPASVLRIPEGGGGWNILDRSSDSQPIGQPTILIPTCSFPNFYNHHRHLKHLVFYFGFLRRKVEIKK